jgi:uncharacterized circularly permuted ATP-grasp superfamily protein
VSLAAKDRIVYDPGGFYDEALEGDGHPRPHYAGALDVLEELDLRALGERAAAEADRLGARFRVDREDRPFRIDPVPRILTRAEWERLERGLTQRAAALNLFMGDVYGRGEIFDEGVVPDRVAYGADRYESGMQGVHLPAGHAQVAGFDLVRDAVGEWLVLEDNLRTPSGLAYMEAARLACAPLIPGDWPDREEIGDFAALLEAALRAAAPEGIDDPHLVLLSDGPTNSAWFEHDLLARRMGVQLVRPRELTLRDGFVEFATDDGRRRVDVVYRRTDEGRLKDARGRPTWLAELLLDPVRRGRVSVVNAFGTGVADDKLAHAYVEEMIRFYLDEEPELGSVHTYDLAREKRRWWAMRRIDRLVFKPRGGQGGEGVVVGPHANKRDRRAIGRLMRRTIDGHVAQETVPLSRHPTVCGGELAPRHVDLRAFAIGKGTEFSLVRGGLTRVAFGEGDLMVNSSQGGGGKDTWILR